MGKGLLNPINILLIAVCIIAIFRMLMVSSCLIISQFLFIKELRIFDKYIFKKNDGSNKNLKK